MTKEELHAHLLMMDFDLLEKDYTSEEAQVGALKDGHLVAKHRKHGSIRVWYTETRKSGEAAHRRPAYLVCRYRRRMVMATYVPSEADKLIQQLEEVIEAYER